MSSETPNQSPRRRIIQILLLIVVFFTTMASYRYFTRPPKYHPKYQTTAHRFLDLEAQYHSVPDEDYELLDDVITDVKAQTHYDPTITDPAGRKKQLLPIFTTIDSVLLQRNFIFPSGEVTSTLDEALQDRTLSPTELEAELAMPHNARRAEHMKAHANEPFHLIACEPNAFLYMGVAEALGFELKGVNLPVHIFVRAQLDTNHWINWDPNRGRSISDMEYARDWGVRAWQIRDKIFLHSLSPDETLSEMYVNVGVCMGENSAFRGYGPAIECYRKALALDPHSLYANNNLASDLLFAPNLDTNMRNEAMDLAEHAVAIQPYEGFTHCTLAYAWAADGQTANAVAELNKAIQLDPKDDEASSMLPLIAAGQTSYAAFKSGSPFTHWLEYENGWIYMLISLGIAAAGALFLFFYWIHRRAQQKLSSLPPEIPAQPQPARTAA